MRTAHHQLLDRLIYICYTLQKRKIEWSGCWILHHQETRISQIHFLFVLLGLFSLRLLAPKEIHTLVPSWTLFIFNLDTKFITFLCNAIHFAFEINGEQRGIMLMSEFNKNWSESSGTIAHRQTRWKNYSQSKNSKLFKWWWMDY